MARWMKPEEELPECEVGERVVMIVRERASPRTKMTDSIVVLVAKEGGWGSPDLVYDGYTPEDSILWTYEKDLVKIADACPKLMRGG